MLELAAFTALLLILSIGANIALGIALYATTQAIRDSAHTHPHTSDETLATLVMEAGDRLYQLAARRA